MNIQETRDVIHDDIVQNIFKNKGGAKFKSINGKDIEYAFNKYDDLVFDYQFRDKLKETNSRIRFFTKSRKTGVTGHCGIKKLGSNKSDYEYYLDIAPNVLALVCKRESDYLAKVIGKTSIDRVYCLQYILEHQIIHLMMIIWGYHHKILTGYAAKYYSEHGDLYQCMLNSYFEYTKIHKITPQLTQIKNINESSYQTSIEYLTSLEQYEPSGLPINWDESCYLDSLFMAMFLGASNYYRNNILDINTSNIEYKSFDNKDRPVFIKVCHRDSTINTETETHIYTEALQTTLYDDYKRVLYGKQNFKCSLLRELLSQCLPPMKEKGRFVSYNVVEIYAMIADLYPGIKLRNIPRILKLPGKLPRHDNMNPLAVLQMWDYMEPDKKEGEVPIWNKIDVPVLVFQNGLIPHVRKFNTIEDEKIAIGNFKHIIKKKRAFSEYIINRRYRLFAVVVNIGLGIEGRSGHYISFIRPKKDPDNWYFYNDIGPVWTITNQGSPEEGNLPPATFLDPGTSRPEMFFYQKLRTSPSKDSESSSQSIVWRGKNMITKRTFGTNPPNIDMYFVKDITPGVIFDYYLYNINKPEQFTTQVNEGIYLWRANRNIIDELSNKIKRKDSKSIPGQGIKYSQLDDGEMYRNLLGNLAIYRYTSDQFIVNGYDIHKEGVNLTHLGGTYSTKLEHGFLSGYIFSKVKLSLVEKEYLGNNRRI